MPETFGKWPKHFLYISPTKIDALFGQIDQSLVKRIAKKLTIDLKVLKAELSTTVPDDTVYARLRVILTYLDQRSLIGSMDYPGSYLAGSLQMKWGPFVRWNETPDKAKLVYFGGATAETIIGLGGSREHVFGNVGGSVAHSHSATPEILRVLQKDLGMRLWHEVVDGPDENLALTAVEIASSEMEGPLQPVEFVAKRLLWGDAKGHYGFYGRRRVLLATPLYVALDD